ncbi:MAG: beta-ketoacyl synthase N-terminal-like domain-containing protein, partial [Pelagibacterales bacterium]|nr:beta-ketoacyl synthase N-terminal-like domain-containing protein [Pelagibacterales bacterium]
MRKVVITGLGIISPIGNNAIEVTDSLREAKSGISFDQSHKDMNFRS